jgi:hypothetical protein
VLHLSVFVGLCEGFLGIDAYFGLWKYFFKARVFRKLLAGGRRVPVHAGSFAIQLRANWNIGYLPVPMKTSNKGWHQKWFYVRDDPDSPLPPYLGLSFDDALESWKEAPNAEEIRKVDSLFQTINRLKNEGATGLRIFAALPQWRVLPLML